MRSFAAWNFVSIRDNDIVHFVGVQSFDQFSIDATKKFSILGQRVTAIADFSKVVTHGGLYIPAAVYRGYLGSRCKKKSSCINFRSSRCRNDACRRLHRPILAAQILSQREPVFTPGWSLTGWCFVPVSIELLSGVSLWFRHWLKSLPIFSCVWPLRVSVFKQTGRERDGKSLMVKNVSNFLFYQFHVRYSLPILVRNKRNGSHFQADKITRMNFPPIHKKKRLLRPLIFIQLGPSLYVCSPWFPWNLWEYLSIGPSYFLFY